MIAGFGLLTFKATKPRSDDYEMFPKKIGDRVGKLWDIAHQGMRENRFLRAEKALLTILKIDKKNAAAYNRLGILYAKQKEYKDAIDCFEIASSIEPTASSLHNLGLIYYETENYTKAEAAFQEAINLDDALAARHIAFAKVQEKLGKTSVMLEELEKAVQLEPNKESYALLVKAYANAGEQAKADQAEQKLKAIAKTSTKKRVLRRRRVVI